MRLERHKAASFPLTAVALAVHETPSDEVLHPEGVAHAAARRLVARPVAGALVLADHRVQTQDLERQQVGVRLQLPPQLLHRLLPGGNLRRGTPRAVRVLHFGVAPHDVKVQHGVV